MKKTLSLLSASLFFFSLYVNFLAGTGKLNDISTGEVSGLYPTLFTPAGITFSIWGLIFLLNSVFVLSQIYIAFRKPESFNISLNGIYVGLSITNMSWLFLWHHLHIGLSLMVIIFYLIATLRCYQLMVTPVSEGNKIHRFAYLNFSVYAGWLSVATIANTAVCLTTIGLQPFGTLAIILTIVVLIVALLLAYFFLFYQRNFWYPLVIGWAFFGIFLASKTGTLQGQEVIEVASLGGLFFLAAIYIYRLINMFFIKKSTDSSQKSA